MYVIIQKPVKLIVITLCKYEVPTPFNIKRMGLSFFRHLLILIIS